MQKIQTCFRAAMFTASIVPVSVLADCGCSDTAASIATPTAVAQSANQAPAGNFNASLLNLVASFDASNSHDADGGITSYAWNFGKPASSAANTSSTTAIALNSAQDGTTGRYISAAAKIDGDGKPGFSFTKIGASGETLPASASSWVCVKDNVTGLMWEVKTNDGGLRDSAKNYTNYDSTTQNQLGTGSPPTQAQIDADNNSVGFKNAVNAAGLCGATDWRLPNAPELRGLLVNYAAAYPGSTIDASNASNTQAYVYWTSTPLDGYPGFAWNVSLNNSGVYGYGLRVNYYRVRLVAGSASKTKSPA